VPSSDLSHTGDDDAVAERLANLRALTDSTLTRLDIDEMLGELLTRVREILDVDTAAVLILHEQSKELVATAACGIEDEVRQGVRVPLGTGFAGRVAATKTAVVLNRVDSTTVANPILWEKGIKVMLGLPLLSDDRVLGVVHVGRLENRPFSADDTELLQIVADRVAGAIQSQHLAIERATTLLLERSLEPGTLPSCSGLSFATRYVAAEGRLVGGDWFDLFTLPSGQLWIVVGDVAGHGLHAAVVMGRIRSALRAYTLLDAPSPERVLDLVDRKVNHFEIGTIATVSCAVFDPPYDTMTVAVAGHPPPVVAVPGVPAAFAGIAPSPPIGTHLTHQRSSTTIPLAPDAVVAFYTDGLIERRGESLDVGLERLREAISPGPPNRVAHEIMRHLIGGSVPADDIALVVVGRSGASSEAEIQSHGDNEPVVFAVPYDVTGPLAARRLVRRFASQYTLDNTEVLALIASELVTNAIAYGAAPVHLLLRYQAGETTIEVTDGDPNIDKVRRRADQAEPGGHGLHVVASLAKRWGIQPSPTGKTVWATTQTSRA
jgi:phosphoserine phosphatase RsbU/P